MSFPTIVAHNSGSAANNTAHTITFGSSPQSGDLLILWIGYDNYTVDLTFDSIDVAVGQKLAVNGTTQEVARLCFRVCDGTEGSSTGLTLSGSEFLAYTSILVRGWGWWMCYQESASTPPTSPQALSAVGSADVLWIALAAQRDIGAWSSVPTGYSLANHLVEGNATSSTSIDIGMAAKESASASETPGAWGSTGTGPALTVAVGPALAASGSTVIVIED